MIRLLNRLCRTTSRPFATTKITMPALSPTMEKGTITRWHAKEGDSISTGDELADIETDKATVPLEIQEDSYIAKLMFEEGAKDIPVGAIIAYTVDDEDELANFSIEESSKPEIKEEPKPIQKEASKVIRKSYPDHVKLKMPALSPTMENGKIVSWNVEVGQEVTVGDVIATIETDKATMDFELQEEGYIAKILVAEGESGVLIGTELVILVDSEEDISAFKDYTPGQEEETPETKEEPSKVEQKKSTTVEQKTVMRSGDKVFISPRAKVLLEDNEIDVGTVDIMGTGPNGRIIEQNVQDYLKAPKPQKKTVTVDKQTTTTQQPLPSDLYTELPLSNMRKVIATRLTESKSTIPHYYLSADVEMGPLLAFKKEIQAQTDLKFSVSDFIVKAVSLACMDVPEANSQWHGETIRQFNDCDVSFAVATEEGLITPIIKQANRRTLSDISKNGRELINKAKEKKLKPDEYMGGTFTISNLGMMGIDSFSAVINPPQSCILAVGATRKVPVVDTNAELGFRFADMMNVTVSCDHRVVDGAVGARWLAAFKDYIQRPHLLTL